MKYKGAVFFDADGTIVDGRFGIYTPTEATLETVKKLKRNGFLTALSTGRARFYVPEGLNNIFDCYITTNGAYGEIDGKEVFNTYIPYDKLKALTDFLNEQNINYVAETQKYGFIKQRNEKYMSRLMKLYNFSDEKFFDNIDPLTLQINKLMTSYDDTAKEKLFIDRFSDLYEITSHPANQSSDVSQRGINKGYGIKKLFERIDIDYDNTYAFGDADNDYDMLKVCKYGIAMGEHTKSLEEVSVMITDTVQNDGVSKALLKLGVIE